MPDVYQINTANSITTLANGEGFIYDLNQLASAKIIQKEWLQR